ncbi:YczE/YyaS/YitT family protein [Limnochorda pilosa]|uniref:YczE/YyaS/YitT family protein n=1 Tax=Limnochorda pilosa TaxID=1555112 RepID=UPI00130DDF2A|nr:hypothetical protein [Limnochorda pilosa]
MHPPSLSTVSGPAPSWPGRLAALASRLATFVAGMAVLSAGILLVVKSPWGAAAWDVFHLGVSGRTGLSLGAVIILVSVAVVLITLALGGAWAVRLGTLLNTFLAGAFVDVYELLHLFREPAGWLWGAGYLLAGILAMSFGMVLYLRTGLGAGARDGLMLVVSQRTRLTAGQAKVVIEVSVAMVGWLLGGPLGVGSVAVAVAAGPCSDLFFRLLGPGALGDRVRIPHPAGGSGAPAGTRGVPASQPQQEVLMPEGKE